MRILPVLTVTALALGGCHVNATADAGPTVQRGFPVTGAFTGLSVTGPYAVKVVSGSAPSVAASGHQKSLDDMIVEVSNGVLSIHPVEKKGINLDISNAGRVQVTVTSPALDSATIAGSGRVDVDRVTGNAFKGSIAGSGDLNLDGVDVQTIELAVAGSGDLRASGKARAVKMSIGGSGDIDAGKLTAEDAQASIAGSGNIRGRATHAAEINMQGSGDVEFSGGGKCTISKNGSGDARCS